jgi:5-methylcytosine-specific restriction endonuclease McrA
MPDGAALRTCTKCLEPFPATTDFFNRQPGGKFGLQSRCRPCHKQWYAENKEQHRATVERYRIENADRLREQARAWKARNADRERERHRRSRAAHPARHRATVQRYRDRHPGRQAEWMRAFREANPGLTAAWARAWRKTNLERALAGERERAMRRAVLKRATQIEPIRHAVIVERDGPICHLCLGHVEPADISIDHIIPLARGGPHRYENLAVSHWDCNHRKNARFIPSRRYPNGAPRPSFCA